MFSIPKQLPANRKVNRLESEGGRAFWHNFSADLSEKAATGIHVVVVLTTIIPPHVLPWCPIILQRAAIALT